LFSGDLPGFDLCNEITMMVWIQLPGKYFPWSFAFARPEIDPKYNLRPEVFETI
jgi:hypothetical protein